MTSGPDFYDEAHVFATYTQRRQRPDNPNNTLEKPIVMELIGDVSGKSILDLGCGDGAFGVELRAAGCDFYTGIEASARMIERADAHLKDIDSTFLHHATIEEWSYPSHSFDLVVSRLALHYVSDIQRTFEQVHQSLKPGGYFVFSVEHPVITSCNRSVEATGIRQDWIVDDYFEVGERNVKWMDSEVIKYHRTIENYFLGLQKAGFTVQSLRESSPQPALFNDEALYARRKRIPLFLLLKAQRPL
jgi:SAM-dependent methyltransferase